MTRYCEQSTDSFFALYQQEIYQLFSGSCSDVLSVRGKHFANGNYEKAPKLHNNRVWYSEASGKWCIFFGQHWQVDNCDFVRDNQNTYQGYGWSKSNAIIGDTTAGLGLQTVGQLILPLSSNQ